MHKRYHRHIAGQAVPPRPGFGLVVLFAKQMQAHKVESIYQLAACRVCGMEQEFPVLIQNSAAPRTAARESIPPRRGFFVHSRQEFSHGPRHVISAAECTYRAAFSGGVGLFLGKFCRCLCAWKVGPFCGVSPVSPL